MRIGRLLLSVLICGTACPSFGMDGLANEGCVYNREIYPEGSQRCQAGTQMRCEQGAWGSIGMCEGEPPPQPMPRGGDVVLDPEIE